MANEILTTWGTVLSSVGLVYVVSLAIYRMPIIPLIPIEIPISLEQSVDYRIINGWLELLDFIELSDFIA